MLRVQPAKPAMERGEIRLEHYLINKQRQLYQRRFSISPFVLNQLELGTKRRLLRYVDPDQAVPRGSRVSIA